MLMFCLEDWRGPLGCATVSLQTKVRSVYYTVVLISRIMRLVRTRPSVFPVRARKSKTRRRKKQKFARKFQLGCGSNRCANFELQRSKIKVTGHQKSRENEA